MGSRPFRSAAPHNFPHYPEQCEQRGLKNYTVIQKILPRWQQTGSPRRVLQRLQKKPGRRAYYVRKSFIFGIIGWIFEQGQAHKSRDLKDCPEYDPTVIDTPEVVRKIYE